MRLTLARTIHRSGMRMLAWFTGCSSCLIGQRLRELPLVSTAQQRRFVRQNSNPDL
jgi:hypothetical protein